MNFPHVLLEEQLSTQSITNYLQRITLFYELNVACHNAIADSVQGNKLKIHV